ncbi:hypothetical protein TSAR_003678 [Trichomalopsis sarcophagae]|uniref:Uncharacterized protein n=1 Tax=Trichomalopsis sarcophagae TaxID=543379 RepID=A0A232EV97_9HYME|nr:hypothetical protein TSAR_003678 [Trichomalopsis sarcophagae]
MINAVTITTMNNQPLMLVQALKNLHCVKYSEVRIVASSRSNRKILPHSYHNPIAARYSPHLSTISESPFVTLRRFSPAVSSTTSHTTSLSRPRRIIDTADIDIGVKVNKKEYEASIVEGRSYKALIQNQ